MSTITRDHTNILFNLAVDLVNQSQRNIFLTGKAGSGKTTFLKYIRESCHKQMAVVAPTGVAAINAGGVTIHSFFQLPLSPFIPVERGVREEEAVTRHSLLNRLRVNTEKIKLLNQLELLIIDEISMVRCDTLDAIDTVLRHVRRRQHEPFGGVQLLFIGDMFQLPPVVPNHEWDMLREFYKSPFFFDSRVIHQDPPLYVEFIKIYRQSDEKFIEVLNQVRNNQLDEEGMRVLMDRYHPEFFPDENDGYIILTTHNNKADLINNNELRRLDGESRSFEADVKGDFQEKSFPAEKTLNLKVGAQVMFLKNDTDRSKRYFNGKIGTVARFEEDKIFVKCKDDPSEIEVKKETWQNIRYTLNRSTQSLDEEELGSFTQFPLRLAWSITIHKSQGLTFEKAIIDAGDAFAPGQVYVALSRCTSLDGMILRSRIRTNSINTDPRILEFSSRVRPADQLIAELDASRQGYALSILISTFDFGSAADSCWELYNYVSGHAASFSTESMPWIRELAGMLRARQEIALKFQAQLTRLFADGPFESNEKLNERIGAGAAHFSREIQALTDFIRISPVVTDSKQHAKEFNEGIRDVIAQLALKKHMLDGLEGRFTIDRWQARRSSFVMPSLYLNAYATAAKEKTDVVNPKLLQRLRKHRDAICEREGKPVYLVANSKTLAEMSEFLPQTREELLRITGFGPAKADQYGDGFLDIITGYCTENQLSSRVSELMPKEKRKETLPSDTKYESYRLYREGKSMAEIAELRQLAQSTIESHLVHYVLSGQISIHELVSGEKLSMIEPMIKDFEGGPISPIKEKLGEAVSFGEIRLAIAGRDHRRSKLE